MPARHGIARDRGALDRTPAGADGDLDAVPVEQVHDAPPRARVPYLEMAVDAGVRAVEPMHDLIDRLVRRVTFRDRELRAFLEIDHERDCDACAARPARIRRVATIAREVAMRDRVFRFGVHGLSPPCQPCGAGRRSDRSRTAARSYLEGSAWRGRRASGLAPPRCIATSGSAASLCVRRQGRSTPGSCRMTPGS